MLIRPRFGRPVALSLLILLTAVGALRTAARAGAEDENWYCRGKFIDALAAKDPEGHRAWKSLSAPARAQVEKLIVCESDGSISGVAANRLVHESLHLLDLGAGARTGRASFWVESGRWVGFERRAADARFARARAWTVMSEQERASQRARLYLRTGGDFASLLEELNAYTRGLKTLLRFEPGPVTDLQEGPLELTLFVLRFLEAVRSADPDYYQSRLLDDDSVATATRQLIREAFAVADDWCEREELPALDAGVIASLRTPASREQLERLFGSESPALSASCLEKSGLSP